MITKNSRWNTVRTSQIDCSPGAPECPEIVSLGWRQSALKRPST
jgi:hypothetical protein